VSYHEIEVVYDNGQAAQTVGTLATSGLKTVFEYAESWMKRKIELAPLKLPVAKGVHNLNPKDSISSTFGVFADSLPDGWGTLIMDRWFIKQGVDRKDITPIDRLAFLGNHAMGALCYRPPMLNADTGAAEAVSIGDIAREACELYQGRIEDASRLLALIGGSPGGARPKALMGVSPDNTSFVAGTSRLPVGYTHWLVKFSGETNKHEGALEYTYNQMAEKAGIHVPEHMLISGADGIRHIATKRFDRLPDNGRCHIATACGLLHCDHRDYLIAYKELMRLAWLLTRDVRQAEEQFRRAAFNLFAVNRDDHSKNHGYIMSDAGVWNLSPAYDLTYSTGSRGYHSMDYNGEALNPTEKDLLKVALDGSIGNSTALSIIDEVKTSVSLFKRLAKENGVPTKDITPIANHLDTMLTVKS
jgi:serine/threonine-protein kinase HipA